MLNSVLWLFIDGSVSYYCGWNNIKNLECPIVSKDKKCALKMSAKTAESTIKKLVNFYKDKNVCTKYIIETSNI